MFGAITTYYVSTTGNDGNSGTSSGSPKLTIQAAINAASNGDSIFVANGTYTISTTLDVNKGVVIHGESQAGVILDASGMTPISNRVIETDANNVTLRNMTIKPITDPNPAASNGIGYTIKAGSNSVPTINSNLILHNISIDGAAERTPFDIHGVDSVDILNLSASGTTRGNGISFSGCTDVYVNGFAGTGNAWGSIAVYASRYVPAAGRGSNNVVIVGSSLSIDGIVYAQDDPTFSTPLYNTNVSVTGWDFRVFNDGHRANGSEFTFYCEDETAAGTLATALNALNGGNFTSVVEEISTGYWYVTSDNLRIQTAINEASSGDRIIVRAGTYPEGLSIGKSLTILGPNATESPNTGSRGTEAILKPTGGSGAPDALTGSAASITVVFSGFTIDLIDTRHVTSYNASKRFLTQTGKSGTSWTFEHNIFQDQAAAGNGTWYVSGNTNLVFNLRDNLFRTTDYTATDASNGVAIWGNGPHLIDIRENVWVNNLGWAMNINNCEGMITNNTIKETRGGSIANFWDYQQGIVFSNDFDLTISENQFLGLGSVLNIYHDVDGPIDVIDNTFDGTYNYSVKAAEYEYLAGKNLNGLIIQGNSFLNYSGPAGKQIYSNRQDAQIINAKCNWWGTAVHEDVKAFVDAKTNVVPYETTEGGECACNLVLSIRPFFRPSRYGEFNISTFGGSNGSIQVLIRGNGIPPFDYNWTGPSPITGDTGTSLKAGSYFLEVTDSEGCKGQAGPWNLREPN